MDNWPTTTANTMCEMPQITISVSHGKITNDKSVQITSCTKCCEFQIHADLCESQWLGSTESSVFLDCYLMPNQHV